MPLPDDSSCSHFCLPLHPLLHSLTLSGTQTGISGPKPKTPKTSPRKRRAQVPRATSSLFGTARSVDLNALGRLGTVTRPRTFKKIINLNSHLTPVQYDETYGDDARRILTPLGRRQVRCGRERVPCLHLFWDLNVNDATVRQPRHYPVCACRRKQLACGLLV